MPTALMVVLATIIAALAFQSGWMRHAGGWPWLRLVLCAICLVIPPISLYTAEMVDVEEAIAVGVLLWIAGPFAAWLAISALGTVAGRIWKWWPTD